MTDIAVVIPFYNGSAFVERAIRSVEEQSLKAAELVIVNDGSTDEETAKLQSIAQSHGVRVVDRENGGQGAARNTGVAATSSPYICFLDQDDFFLPNHNRLLAERIDTTDLPFGWSYGDLALEDFEGRLTRTTMVRHYARHPKTHIRHCLSSDMFVLPSASLISRQAFESVGGFDPQFIGYEDDDLFLRMFCAGYGNVFVPNSVTVWRRHAGSTSGSMMMRRSRSRYFRKLCETFPDQPEAGLYFKRDMFLRRFENSFWQDVVIAYLEEDSTLVEHRETLVDAFVEFAGVALESGDVGRGDKRRIRRKTALLKTRSPVLITTAIRVRNALGGLLRLGSRQTKRRNRP